ncbi:hypothetical protein GIB67_019673 [Kingdonia uniflora]|uniref:Uncharacterized protein n=1 Tax=Kingdonia uniflora TaxID=39325 RepID=A0A7J7MJV4_9MAGN|nr:hypothetical protein GIB67_019673 [Kingdonia uniflora]
METGPLFLLSSVSLLFLIDHHLWFHRYPLLLRAPTTNEAMTPKCHNKKLSSVSLLFLIDHHLWFHRYPLLLRAPTTNEAMTPKCHNKKLSPKQ